MNKFDRESKKQLLTAGIWSAAVLAVIAVGMMTFFSAASRRPSLPEPERPAVTDTHLLPKPKPKPGETAGTASGTQELPQETPVPLTKPEEKPEKQTETPPDAEVSSAAEPETEAVSPEEVRNGKVPASSYPDNGSFSCIMPTAGTVTKGFTADVAVYSLTMNDYRVHSGIDIAAPVGTKVTACAAGTVERVWEDPFLGSCVLISHGQDMQSMYANLSPDRPKGMEAGATVLAGDVIGGIGETMTVEMADTDHLHFCIYEDGIPVDPLAYVTNYQGDMPLSAP